MSEDKDTDTSRVIKFSGQDSKWREWSAKFKAIGTKKGWWKEFEHDDDIDFEKKTQAPFKDRIEDNNSAFHYLTLACSGEAFEYIEGTEGNARLAWKNLKSRYEANESSDLIGLIEAFTRCKMKDNDLNPDCWFHELEHLHRRIILAGGAKRMMRNSSLMS